MKISSTAIINIGNFHQNVVEYKSEKYDTSYWLYFPYAHQEPKLLMINKGANINFGNIA